MTPRVSIGLPYLTSRYTTTLIYLGDETATPQQSTISAVAMIERRIVVSIDFGTTYSGVAWADTTRPEIQHVLSNWPGVGSFKSSPKVPTELRKVASGWQWGFQIPESAKRSRFFKLSVCQSSVLGRLNLII